MIGMYAESISTLVWWIESHLTFFSQYRWIESCNEFLLYECYILLTVQNVAYGLFAVQFRYEFTKRSSGIIHRAALDVTIILTISLYYYSLWNVYQWTQFTVLSNLIVFETRLYHCLELKLSRVLNQTKPHFLYYQY